MNMAKMSIDTSVWYKPHIGNRLKPATRNLFEKWSGIQGDELNTHLHNIRDKAWPIGEYPCVGEWIFLLPGIFDYDQFSRILKRAKRPGARILDLGCGFGQDLRRFANLGVLTDNMFALDMSPDLWKLGYELFRDSQKMKAKFIQANFLEAETKLSELWGNTDIIVAAQFLHLFSLDGQIAATKKIVRLSKPGTIVVGYQQGRLQAREYPRPWGTMFYHNLDTFKAMWENVQRETGTTWTVDATLVDLHEWGMEDEDIEWMPPDRTGINFVITRDR